MSSEVSLAGTPAASPLGYFSWTSGQLARDPYYILVVIYIFFPYFSGAVVGDPVYGRKSRNASQPASLRTFGRQALHAAVLEFRHPRTGKEMRFATELPQDIRMLVAELNSVK